MPFVTRRNFLSVGTASFAALAASKFTVVELHAAPKKARSTPDAVFDAYVATYMRAMNAPGITFGSANKSGTVRVTAYGFDDPETNHRVSPDELFHIGSITKSFVALVMLQLREEGKLDLDRPVLEYLPWLPIENSFGAITTHHLLTHTSGLPDALTLFPTDRRDKSIQAYEPGKKFYYCNLGFDILGHLIEHLDGHSWPSSVKARVIDRVGMKSTFPNILNDQRPHTAKSWIPYYQDRPYPRQGKLAPAGSFQFDDAAGSIASTPKDMTLYAQMLLNQGQASGGGRIISEESFALMSKPHIKAEEFGPTASYGYGIAVDTLDKHPVLRHTGGMPSFASAILLDLESGNGAFASINAMQGYRPTAIVQYAVQLMNAGTNSTAPVTPPVITDPNVIDNAADYHGSYVTTDGKKIDISGDKQLIATVNGRKVVLQHTEEDSFLTDDPEFSRYTFTFGRVKAPEKEKGSAKESESKPDSKSEEKPKPQPVIELMHGPDWYRNDKYTGPIDFKTPENYKALTGYYLGAGAFPADAEILIRKGELWLEGGFKLVQIGENEFVPDNGMPERVEFLFVVDGKARLMKFSGIDLARFERT